MTITIPPPGFSLKQSSASTTDCPRPFSRVRALSCIKTETLIDSLLLYIRSVLNISCDIYIYIYIYIYMCVTRHAKTRLL
jgi:hypothetical protein